MADQSQTKSQGTASDTAQSVLAGNPKLHPVIEQVMGSAPADSVSFQSVQELESLLKAETESIQSILALPVDVFSEKILAQLKVRFFGKKSPFQHLLTRLRDLPAESRKDAGARINAVKKTAEAQLELFFAAVWIEIENQALAAENIDISLSLDPAAIGSRHPVSVVARELIAPLTRMGFTVVDGPELELDFYNFEALNLPKEHSAREMQDTCFLAKGLSQKKSDASSEWLLRTHTSSVQVHALLERGAPLKVVCPGYTYRNEYDMTHVPTFRQIEGLVVDKGIHFGHLRHTLNTFFNEIFGRPVKMRFRSSYFPFTEPSAEMDVQCQQCFGAGCRACKHTGWLEMGGCGLVHRKVLEACKVPGEYSGFAFGMGIDRIAMSKFGISDLRALTEGDLSYLSSFHLS